MALADIIRESLSYGVLLSHIGLILFGLFFLLRKRLATWYLPTKAFLTRHALLFSFLAAVIATAGSLTFSIFLGWEPCEFCWYQRIFMYPLVIILGLALWKKRDDVRLYTIPLAVTGLVLAAYHYVIQLGPTTYACSTGISCTFSYFTSFAYITIPMMAVTGFVLILFFMLFLRKN